MYVVCKPGWNLRVSEAPGKKPFINLHKDNAPDNLYQAEQILSAYDIVPTKQWLNGVVAYGNPTWTTFAKRRGFIMRLLYRLGRYK